MIYLEHRSKNNSDLVDGDEHDDDDYEEDIEDEEEVNYADVEDHLSVDSNVITNLTSDEHGSSAVDNLTASEEGLSALPDNTASKVLIKKKAQNKLEASADKIKREMLEKGAE